MKMNVKAHYQVHVKHKTCYTTGFSHEGAGQAFVCIENSFICLLALKLPQEHFSSPLFSVESKDLLLLPSLGPLHFHSFGLWKSHQTSHKVLGCNHDCAGDAEEAKCGDGNGDLSRVIEGGVKICLLWHPS